MMRRTILLMATMALTLLVASGVVLAATIGSAGAQSSVVGPGESIQKAINAADPGDTMVVRGVHREDVIIRKDGIKLRGDDALIEAPQEPRQTRPARSSLDRRLFASSATSTSKPARSTSVQLETDVAKDSPEDAVKSFRYSDGFVASIDRGEQSRTIILDMKGEAVSIGVGFPRAQKVVDTVKWGGS